MITTSKLNKMYELVIDKEYLTKQDIESCGFDFADILNLLEKGHLKALGDLKFILLEVDDLYRYGMKLSKINNERANKCFEKCFELNSNYQKNLVSLFYNSIINEDLTQALYYIELMRKTNKIEYIKDSNFYLYLLNNIYELPDKYKEIAINLTLDDIKISDVDIRYGNIEMLNDARIMAFEKNFFHSIRLIREATADGSYTFYDKVAKTLVSKAGDAEVERRNQLYELIKFKNYDEAFKHLIDKEKKLGLSNYDIYLKKLVQEIQQIESSLYIPEKEIGNTKKIFDAIDCKNYKYALYLCENYHKSIENTLYLLLIDICEIINKVSAHNLTFKSIKKYYDELDYKKLIKTIRNYLNLTNSIEYEFLVISYVKLALYKNDNNLEETKHLLYKIHNGSFKFEINDYINKFNIAIDEFKIEEAKIYFDIISKYAISFDISNLKAKIENCQTSKLDNCNESCNVAITEIDNSINNCEISDLEKRIEEIYNYLVVNKGIVILDYLTYDQRHIVYDIIKTYPDLEVRSIGDGDFKKIYLRYKIRNEEIINYRLLRNCVNTAFERKQYDIAISYGLQLLQYGIPDAGIYSKIGMAYLHLNKPEMAYQYMLIAFELEQNERLKNEYGTHLKNNSSYADAMVFDVEDSFDKNTLLQQNEETDFTQEFGNRTSNQTLISKILLKIRRK